MPLRSTRFFFSGLLAAVVLQGCAESAPTTPAVVRDGAMTPAASIRQFESQQIDLTTRAIASALREDALRRQLLVDLRDSPFPGHRIHLRSYFAGQRGKAIAIAAAASLGISRDSLFAAMNKLPDLQIWVPLLSDRLTWSGTDSAVVVGHTIPKEEVPSLGSIRGYSTATGEAVLVPTGVAVGYPLIAVAPADIEFGRDPEQRRRSAPRRTGKTISTSEEAFSVMSTADCDPTTAVIECNNEGTVGGGEAWTSGVKLPSDYTYQCMVAAGSAGDTDGDGLLQQCEYEIAHAFRPYLQWDLGEDASNKQNYWAARRVSSTRVKIIHLMAYFEDAGQYETWTKHDGDSEFIIMEVEYKNGWWRFNNAFLSAHWDVMYWDASSTRAAGEFAYPEGAPFAHPKIWIAEDKHANYSSQGKCDEGANYQDNCNQPINALEHLGIVADRNIGNRESGTTKLIDCVVRTAHGGGGTRNECLWTYNQFAGWQDKYEKNAPSYSKVLGAFDF